MERGIGATMQITETQPTLNSYACLEQDFDTKNVTSVHSKANGTKYYTGNCMLNINVHKYIEVFTRKNKASLAIGYTFLS